MGHPTSLTQVAVIPNSLYLTIKDKELKAWEVPIHPSPELLTLSKCSTNPTFFYY